jgi:hypothetical protein
MRGLSFIYRSDSLVDAATAAISLMEGSLVEGIESSRVLRYRSEGGRVAAI